MMAKAPTIEEGAPLGGKGGTDLEPLLERSIAAEQPCDWLQRRAGSKAKRNLSCLVVIGAAAALLLLVHVLFVALLRKTTVTLDQLMLPDLCHRHTTGEVVVEFQNPSYCSPRIGSLNITFSKNTTAFLRLEAPGFELQSGVTTMVSAVDFHLLTTPEELYSLVFADDATIDVRGAIPIHISCMLIPFTISVDVSNLLRENPQPPQHHNIPSKWRYALDPPLDTGDRWSSGVVNGIKAELQHIVQQVLKTIALSHIHTEKDEQEVFAFTDVSFQYASRTLWNIPSLSIDVQSAERQTIMVAGFKRFLLGSGHTFISAYTEIFKNQSAPLQSMLQTYLAGHDVTLHVNGGNRDTDCFSLQVLELVDVKVEIPAKIDGKPALLREYAIHPTLKELDSKTRTCLLELKVAIKINNPLPIHFDLFAIEFDLLYKKERSSRESQERRPTFLLHVDDTSHISWAAHKENSIVFDTAVREFDTCKDVVGLYLHDELAFDIQHGHISMGAGSGNFSIPFSVTDIHIHPSIRQHAANDSVHSP
ncbi:hypothetical protein BBJ28_00001810 [Nothophytophthora sp. Chile5]|nr:hypothetical protein BBJ28_00001810 [Nothophytophthora sp. Chile5]